MKKPTFTITIVVTAAFAGAVPAANGRDIEIELAADYFGKYIWRGQNLVDDPVFQPGLSLHYEGVTAAIWASLETTNINGNSGDFSEIDWSVDYSAAVPGLEGLAYSVGAIYYDFPGTTIRDTTELYCGLALVAPLNPSIRFYRDVDEADGVYVSIAAGHTVEKLAELAPGVPAALDISASLGWGSASYNSYYWGVGGGEFNDLAVSASFSFEIHGWTVSPGVRYVTLLSDKIRGADSYGPKSDFFFGGISLSKEF